MDVILEHGRRLLGFRPLSADGNLPPVVVENGALRLGMEIIRTATQQDAKDFPEVESDDWEHHGICDEIKKRFAAKVIHGANKRAPLPPKLAVKRLGGVDEKALRILLGVHWEKGWKQGQTISPADFDYAFKAGLMFHPMKLGHDDAIKRLKRVCREITPRMVAHAFVASLGSRRLDLRSALGSFARWRHVPAHRYDPLDAKAPNTTWCLVCGNSNAEAEHDLNCLNFERFKWGGVRHDDPVYAWFDLERFLAAVRPEPAPEDWRILKAILKIAGSLPPKALLSDLVSKLAKAVDSNPDERKQMISILGYAGILQSKRCMGFLEHFVDVEKHSAPPGSDGGDWRYPIMWWRGVDGVNQKAVKHWFPELS
jgi:hypothetical protein